MPRFAPARLAAPVLIALALAGCGSDAPVEDAPAAADAPGLDQPAAAPAVNATLDLEADGIVIPAQAGAGQAEQLVLPFGTLRPAAETTLATVAGAPLSRGHNEECGAGPMGVTQFDGVVLHFQDERLVGYYATAPYVPELTRAELLADPAVALVADSTIGAEFTIGDREGPAIGGLFTGESDDARVESLWAGVTCMFR